MEFHFTYTLCHFFSHGNVGRIRERLKKMFNKGENVTKFKKKMAQLLTVFFFRNEISALNFITTDYFKCTIINYILF